MYADKGPWKNKIWKEERKKIITDKSQCEFCGSKIKLCVHHLIRYKDEKDYSELKDKKHIVILCNRCHFIFHKYGQKICSKCKKKYHTFGYDCCYNCLPERTKNEIDRRKSFYNDDNLDMSVEEFEGEGTYEDLEEDDDEDDYF